MIVYRTMSSRELLSLIGNTEYSSSKKWSGYNTFNYEDEKEYIHFFKYEGHALGLMKNRNNPVIVKVNIPDEILPGVNYGYYYGIETPYDDTLRTYNIPLPEYILDKQLMKKEYIVDFSYDGIWQNPLNVETPITYFWVERKIFNQTKSQMWTLESIYYEYIKILLSRFNYNVVKVALFLKYVDLDKEIEKLSDSIKKEKVITLKKKTFEF